MIFLSQVMATDLVDLKRLYSRGQIELMFMNLTEGQVQIDQSVAEFFHGVLEEVEMTKKRKIEILQKFYRQTKPFYRDLVPSRAVRKKIVDDIISDEKLVVVELKKAIANNSIPMATRENLFYFQLGNSILSYCKTSDYECFDMYLHSLRRTNLLKYSDMSYFFMAKNKRARQETRIERLLETYLKLFREDDLEDITSKEYVEKIKVAKKWQEKIK